MSVDEFIAKSSGDESEAKSMLERDPGLLNKQGSDGRTGLMEALSNKNHSLSRWLLSLPRLDTNLGKSSHNSTASIFLVDTVELICNLITVLAFQG